MAFTAALPCLAEVSAANSPDKAEGYEAKILTGGAELPSYKASDVYGTSTNTDPVWRWQYRNPETKIPYTDLDKAGRNNRDMDVNGKNYRAEQSWKINDYGNGFAVSKYLMVGGNRSDGGGWASADTAVRTFIAPNSGNITITACGPTDDENGKVWGAITSGNPQGAKISINKTDAGDTEHKNIKRVWPSDSDGYQFLWNESSEQNGMVLDFEPLTISVNKGDELHFESASNYSENWWGTTIFWNPMVTYTSYNPTVKSLAASEGNFENASLNQSYSVTFEETLNSISVENISIAGRLNDGSALKNTPSVSTTALSEDKKTVTFSFSGLEKSAEYTVTLKNMDFDGMDAGAFVYSFGFKTKQPAASISYKASDSYSASGNIDSVWRLQYKNDNIIYTDLTKTGWSNLNVAADGKTVTAGDSWKINDYQNGFAVSKYLMVGGNVADGDATVNSDVAVKTFTVPKSGYVTIGASDPNGNSKVWSNLTSVNNPGASISVSKTEAGDDKYLTTEMIWPKDGKAYQFKWDENNQEKCSEVEFEPITVRVNAGDKLHFETAAKDGNWWGMVVYWDPIVSYKAVFPEAVDKNFEDGGRYAPNYEYSMEFDDDMAPLSTENIKIDGGASVKSAEVNEGRRVTFSFDGIKEGVRYNVTVSGLRYDTVDDPNMSEPYTFSFIGGSAVEALNARLGTPHIKAGENKVYVSVNNSGAEKCSASMLVCLMKGTADNYEVESVNYVSRDDIGANDTMSVSVEVDDSNDRFIRVLVVKSVNGLCPYAEAMDLK